MSLLVAIGIGVLSIAVSLWALVLLLHLLRTSQQAMYRSIVETPTTPVAQIRREGLVELQGCAVASDQGSVTSPLSGKPVLTYHVDIKVDRGGPGASWHVAESLRDRREFWLDDGSGQRAWVTPHDAKTVMTVTRYGGPPTVGGPPMTHYDLTPEMERWARTRSGASGGRILVDSREIALGSHIYALGWASLPDGIVCMRQAPGRQLVLSTFNEQQLLDILGSRAGALRIFTVMSLACTAIGALLIVVGLVVS